MFDRVVLTCPVKRLGSLMDLSPVLEGVGRLFPGRLVLGKLSDQAKVLWRHKLAALVQRGEAEDATVQRAFLLKEALNRKAVLGIPLADDQNGSFLSYDLLTERVPEQSVLIGLDKTAEPIRDYFEGDDDHCPPWEARGRASVFDHTVKTQASTFPKPQVLNGAVEIVRTAKRLAPTSNQAALDGFEAKPYIWTSDHEVEIAHRFMRQIGWESEPTIGLHLTAGSYAVYDQIWPKDNFMAVARHFIEKGYKVLLVTGGIGRSGAAEADQYWRLHQEFKEGLQTTYASSVYAHSIGLFHGDTLENAELIRRCAVFFSAETGPAHVASAVGTPKVTIANSQSQADIWMLTGPRDFGFVTEREEARITKPTVTQVIGAMEQVLQRRG